MLSTTDWRQRGDRFARSVQACVAKWRILNIAALSRSLSIQQARGGGGL